MPHIRTWEFSRSTVVMDSDGFKGGVKQCETDRHFAKATWSMFGCTLCLWWFSIALAAIVQETQPAMPRPEVGRSVNHL